MLPIGWAVTDANGRVALVLDRPAADAMAARLHGTVDAVYAAAHVGRMIDEIVALRHALAAATAEAQPGGG